ncbi:MAG: hypothetical protein RI568_08215 [Natronomonas sp.]|jgi:hypothetical protein|uniref:hypothetical protein n=1 Tax=Natronomonas TaxID=63743 RepID=UPI001485AA5C|nr:MULTISPECIES: hypothetical protein [Natronomonas]MDR9430665.1 hypothetical protein [Natronomonas sp.]
MVEQTTPYEYGDVELEAVGENPPHEQQHGADMVIVDGSTMSYRSYAKIETE